MRRFVTCTLLLAAACGAFDAKAQQPPLQSPEFCLALKRVEAQGIQDRFRSWRGEQVMIFYRATYLLPGAPRCGIDLENQYDCSWDVEGPDADRLVDALAARIKACLPGASGIRLKGSAHALESSAGRVEWRVTKHEKLKRVYITVEVP